MSRRIPPFLVLLGVSPLLVAKGCGDRGDDPTLPDGTTTTTGIFGTTATTGTTTDVTTTENLDCRIAWLDLTVQMGGTTPLPDDPFDIVIAGPTGDGPERLTTSGGAHGEVLAFSPDGQWLAYLVDANDDRGTFYHVAKMRIDGSGRQVLTTGSLLGPREGPDLLKWSPDGQWIALVTEEYFEVPTTGGYVDVDTDGEDHLVAIRTDGTGTETVADQNVSQGFDWAPDGALIWVNGWAREVMRAASPTTAGVTVTQTPGAIGTGLLEVSPDGTAIATSGRRHDGQELTVTRLDGSGSTFLGNHLTAPEWSPDGSLLLARRLVLDSPEPAGVELVTVDPTGAGESVVAYTGGPDTNSWIGEWNKWGAGDHIYFPQLWNLDRGDHGMVTVVTSTGGSPVTVVDSPNYMISGFDVSPLCFD